MTDSGGRAVVIGSACRWITFQAPSSGRKTLVVLRVTGTTSAPPPILALKRSTSTIKARPGVEHFANVSKPTTSPSLHRDAARSIVAAACSHPQATGPNGLATLTSSASENTARYGAG